MNRGLSRIQWVFDLKTDMSMFVLPTVLGLLFLASAHLTGLDISSERTLLIQFALYLVFDYAHTYAILFRTYLDSTAQRVYRNLLIWIPIGVFILGIGLFSISLQAFWTFFGYLQVYHFIRQQYGWMKLAERTSRPSRIDSFLNSAAVYACTGYPVIYWHTYLREKFYWYKNMLQLPAVPIAIERVAFFAFVAIGIAFCARIIWIYLNERNLSVGRLLVFIQTFFIWYVGLVVLEVSIVSFAALNTIGHGLPYILFIYRYMRRNWNQESPWRAPFLGAYGFALFYVCLLAFAYFETYLQYTFQENNYDMAFFGTFWALPNSILVWLIPLLMVPQATHSVLDGFIWRFRGQREIDLLAKMVDA